MKTVTAKELKNRTGEVIKCIRRGEEVMVSYRGKPLAKFVPLKEASVLEELSGILKRDIKNIKQIKGERLKEKYEDIS